MLLKRLGVLNEVAHAQHEQAASVAASESPPPRCSCIIVIQANQYWATRYQMVWARRGSRRQHESHGQLLRQQRASGTLLQFAEERTRAASAVSESGRRPGRRSWRLSRSALPASAGIRRWAIGAQRRSSRWPVSLHPGVRYFQATSGLAITQLPFDTSFVPRLSASDAAHRRMPTQLYY